MGVLEDLVRARRVFQRRDRDVRQHASRSRPHVAVELRGGPSRRRCGADGVQSPSSMRCSPVKLRVASPPGMPPGCRRSRCSARRTRRRPPPAGGSLRRPFSQAAATPPGAGSREGSAHCDVANVPRIPEARSQPRASRLGDRPIEGPAPPRARARGPAARRPRLPRPSRRCWRLRVSLQRGQWRPPPTCGGRWLGSPPPPTPSAVRTKNPASALSRTGADRQAARVTSGAGRQTDRRRLPGPGPTGEYCEREPKGAPGRPKSNRRRSSPSLFTRSPRGPSPAP